MQEAYPVSQMEGNVPVVRESDTASGPSAICGALNGTHHPGCGGKVVSRTNGILSSLDNLVALKEPRERYLDELQPITVQEVTDQGNNQEALPSDLGKGSSVLIPHTANSYLLLLETSLEQLTDSMTSG